MLKQVDAYITWINRHLEHHPHRRLVKDLQKDMRDGVAFLQLVEVIGGVDQNILYDKQLTLADIQSNINRVLDFLSNNNVRIHHILPKEIIEGKLKPIMRLILLLAAHFKPEEETLNRTFPASKSRKKLERTPSIVSILSNAAVSLADAKGNASGSSFKCKNPGNQRSSVGSWSEYDESDAPRTPSPKKTLSRSLFTPSARASQDSPKRSLFVDEKRRRDLTSTPCAPKDGQRPLSSPIGQRPPSSPNNDAITPKKTIAKYFNTESPLASELQLSDSLDGDIVSMDQVAEVMDKNYDISFLTGLMNCHDEMIDDIGVTKMVLTELQNLIVNGGGTDCSEDFMPSMDETFQEQLIMRTVMLEQKEEECLQLKSDLNELKEMHFQWSGEKVAYQTRLTQQEQVILALKCSLLQHEISGGKKKKDDQQAAETATAKEIEQLKTQVAEQQKMIDKQKDELSKLGAELEKRSVAEAGLHSKLEIEESKAGNLSKQLHELSERMHSLSVCDKVRDEENLNALNERLNQAKFRRDYERILREHKTMCITLHNLRNTFKPDDPAQHAFESIELSITTFVDTLTTIATTLQTKETNPKHNISLPLPLLNSSSCSQSSNSSDSGVTNTLSASGDQLKVIYYTGKSTTPVLRFSDTALGLLTLRDFKQVVGRSGKYRYYFKCVDSEYGFVREELVCDDDVIPGYDNKVVAWLERRTTPVSDV